MPGVLKNIKFLLIWDLASDLFKMNNRCKMLLITEPWLNKFTGGKMMSDLFMKKWTLPLILDETPGNLLQG